MPLYEAKMFHQFDHRFSTYEGATQKQLNVGILPRLSIESKQNPSYIVTPRYWVSKTEVENRLNDRWNKEWLLGWRDICRATDERTVVSSLLPLSGCGDTVLLMLPQVNKVNLITCLLANLDSIVFDFVARQKVGGTHLKFFTMRQLPIIPPNRYTKTDIEYIVPRVLELVYTAYDLKPFAEDIWKELDEKNRETLMQRWEKNHQQKPPENCKIESENCELSPYLWDEQRRAKIRAELDAKYAQLYQLTRDELRYVLDPADIYGPDFPSETFRVLKNNEMKKYGEYRTQRLVLAAFDMLGV